MPFTGLFIRFLLGLFFIVAACYWLFADTVRHYSTADDSNRIRVTFWGDYEEFRMWQQIAFAFSEKYPDLAVKLEYLPGSQYTAKIQQQLIADAAPDVILYQDEPFPRLIESGKVEDLSAYLNTPGASLELHDYWQSAVDSFVLKRADLPDAKVIPYGIPIWGGVNLIFYNRDCFERSRVRVEKLPGPAGLNKNGPDGYWLLDDERWTIDEFIEVAKRLTIDLDHDGRIDQYGFQLPGFLYWFPWHQSFGARILNKTLDKVAFHDEACERSLQLYQDLRYRYHVSPTMEDASAVSGNAGFLTGRIAMESTGPWGMPFRNAAKSNYDVLHIPHDGPDGFRSTRITWDTLFMFAGSKKKRQAWLFIHFATSMVSQKIVADTQRSIPALKAASTYFEKEEGHYQRPVSVEKFIEATAQYAEMQPMTRYWDQMIRAVNQGVEGLQLPNAQQRYTPQEAIGAVLDHPDIKNIWAAVDPLEASRYIEIWKRSGKKR